MFDDGEKIGTKLIVGDEHPDMQKATVGVW
jgi:hypothetical protein